MEIITRSFILQSTKTLCYITVDSSYLQNLKDSAANFSNFCHRER